MNRAPTYQRVPHEKDLGPGTAGDVLADVLLHHEGASRGRGSVVIQAVVVGQGDTAGTRDQLEDQVLYRHHHIQVIAWSLAPR